jgi:hypothetical protein
MEIQRFDLERDITAWITVFEGPIRSGIVQQMFHYTALSCIVAEQLEFQVGHRSEKNFGDVMIISEQY